MVAAPALAQVATAPPGQATAPSSITPETLRPLPSAGGEAVVVPPIDRLTPPPGSAGLSVTPSALMVEGAFPEVASEVAAIAADYAGQRVTLAQLYAGASAIEAAHVRAGYVLARVTVPPQTLRDGEPVRIVVIDGHFESIDAGGVPARVRAAVLARTAGLIGRKHLTLAAIERPLLLAGDVPGLTLTSTLARGREAGGARLLLAGRQRLVSGIVSADNGFARSLGRYGVTAQVSLNSALGLGEQVYGFVTSGWNPALAFRSEAPVRVLGGGVVLPSGDGRFSLNPEATFSRTQPLAQAGVPRTRGRLRRLTLRAGYVAAKTRRRSFTLGATIEQLQESNDAIDFATRLSLDRYVAARVQASWSTTLARGGGVALTAEASHGLGGIDARGTAGDPATIAGSRQGAGPRFTRLAATIRLAEPLPRAFQLGMTVRGQTSFGQPLLRAEQSALEGADAVSAYVGGITAVDQSITARLELSHAFALPSVRGVQLLPYLFAAAGHGWIARPTAIEAAALTLGAAGTGLRAGLGRSSITLGLEYARGIADRTGYDRVDRIAVSVAKRF